MLHLTPEICRSAYEFLRSTPPFSRWRLPSGAEVVFGIVAHDRFTAEHSVEIKSGRHVVQFSRRRVAGTLNLIDTMAHEIIHMAQHIHREPAGHGASFERRRKQIRRYHTLAVEL